MSIAIKEFLKVLGSPQNPDSGRPLIGLDHLKILIVEGPSLVWRAQGRRMIDVCEIVWAWFSMASLTTIRVRTPLKNLNVRIHQRVFVTLYFWLFCSSPLLIVILVAYSPPPGVIFGSSGPVQIENAQSSEVSRPADFRPIY